MAKKKKVHVSGKRKTAVARANIKKGSGILRVNGQLLRTYGNNMIRMMIKEPLKLAEGLSEEVNIEVKVEGGGNMAQAQAARLAIARGLVKYSGDEELKEKFLEYDRHLLVADIRKKEPQKPYRSAARSKRQKSKR